jgi:hypothetical protein
MAGCHKSSCQGGRNNGELGGLIDNAMDGINTNTGEKEADSNSDFSASVPFLKPSEFQYRNQICNCDTMFNARAKLGTDVSPDSHKFAL